MNLSCGQCRKIQPFSGEPLRCEVCGWMIEAPSGGEPTPYFKPKLKKDPVWVYLRGLGSIVMLILVVQFIAYLFRSEKEKLAEKYNISVDRVIIEMKPHGCDFDDAPLGNKHCHYEKDVLPMRDCDACPVKSVYVSWRKVEE